MAFFRFRRLSTQDKLCIAMSKLGEREAENRLLRSQVEEMKSSAGRSLAGVRYSKDKEKQREMTRKLRAGLGGTRDGYGELIRRDA